jgi:hypothetical protein
MRAAKIRKAPARLAHVGVESGVLPAREPSPEPSTARPPERWSRNAIFSATAAGSFHGEDDRAGGEAMRRVRREEAENCVLSGQAA